MTNLEQIVKQVSLLNRLIELLRMQEEPSNEALEELGTFSWICGRRAYSENRTYACARDDIDYTIEDAWKHPTTQKAWSDELVKVARELWDNSPLHRGIASIVNDIGQEDCCFSSLEAILNKYGRGLNE